MGQGIPSDRRVKQRRQANLRVDFKVGAHVGRAITTDLSETGVFVNTNKLAPLGHEIALKLYFSDKGEPLKALGAIRRTVKPGEGPLVGMGIEFERIYAGSRQLLRSFLSEGMGVEINESALGDILADEEGSRMARYVFDKNNQIKRPPPTTPAATAAKARPSSRPKAKAKSEDIEILEKFQFAPTLLKRIGWKPIIIGGAIVGFYIAMSKVMDLLQKL